MSCPSANATCFVGPDKTLLKNAVKEWVNDTPSAETKYGKINEWDVSRVETMENLFKKKLQITMPMVLLLT